jgi:monofunctional glycosyltransferase
MKKWLKRIVVGILCAAIAVLAGAVGILAWRGYKMYRTAISAVPLAERVAAVQAQPNYTTLEELPKIYPQAVLSVEDRRFYSHPGVDFLAVGRACFVNLTTRSLREGGSTITQQLAKNLYFSQEKQFERKAAEVFMAFAIEHSYSKDEIFELYINCIYYGSGYYNIYDASEGYFGKAPSALDDAECTLLAGLPNAPSAYSPDKSPTLALARQRKVLDAMVKNHRLTRARADIMLAESTECFAPEA